jgi:hypothetical protein
LLRQVLALGVAMRDPGAFAGPERGFLAVPTAEAAIAAVVGAGVGDAALIDLIEAAVGGGDLLRARRAQFVIAIPATAVLCVGDSDEAAEQSDG